MKWLRVSVYRPDGTPDSTVVTSERDLVAPPEIIANDMRARRGYPDSVDIEVFEGPVTLEEAVVAAGKRAGRRLTQVERHQGTVYDWLVTWFMSTQPTGVISTTRPSPLAGDKIAEVLLRSAEHPSYRGQRVRFWGNDGKYVELKDGRVAVFD